VSRVTGRRLGWTALVVAVAAAFYVGTTDRSAASDQERVMSIAATVACPACAGESAANSQAPAARNVRNEIANGVAAHKSDDEIRAQLVAAYGDSILLTPPSGGAASIVWILPVAGLVIGLAALTYTFRRWRNGVSTP
jgi:cytochrome c-type biogenesis protein CcmH